MIARPLAFLGWSLSLAFGLLAGIVVVGGHTGHGPVYSVSAVRMYLARDPKHWIGRSIQVRGEVVPCLAMPSAENGQCVRLAPSGQPQPPAAATADLLPIALAGIDPFLASLRRLPLLGSLLPAPQALQWGVPAIYLVRLEGMPKSICGTGTCIEAILVDAAP